MLIRTILSSILVFCVEPVVGHAIESRIVDITSDDHNRYYLLINSLPRDPHTGHKIQVPSIIRLNEDGSKDSEFFEDGVLTVADAAEGLLFSSAITTDAGGENVYVLSANTEEAAFDSSPNYTVTGISTADGRVTQSSRPLVVESKSLDSADLKFLVDGESIFIVEYWVSSETHRPRVRMTRLSTDLEAQYVKNDIRGDIIEFDEAQDGIFPEEFKVLSLSVNKNGNIILSFYYNRNNQIIALEMNKFTGELLDKTVISHSDYSNANDYYFVHSTEGPVITVAHDVKANKPGYLVNNSGIKLNLDGHNPTIYSGINNDPIVLELPPESGPEGVGELGRILHFSSSGQVKRQLHVQSFKVPNPCEYLHRFLNGTSSGF